MQKREKIKFILIYFCLPMIFFTLIFFSCHKEPKQLKHEMRAVWLSRFEYAEGKTRAESQEYIRNSFKKISEANINTVIFQVRGNADAFYQSDLEPWSNMLSDTLGKNPGWDPLAMTIQLAQKYGLELHAWVNTFPAWRVDDPPPEPSDPLHPLLAHPEWVVCDSMGMTMKPGEGYICFSPGNPDVQTHLSNVVMDIIEKYDVDGIHFDYIRYPEMSVDLKYSHDSVSIQRFQSEENNPGKFSWENWQREQVNLFVERIYNQVTDRKPWIKVSAAVLGYQYGRMWNGYGSVYQDARRWLSIGKMDMAFPMMYLTIGNPYASFERALTQWKSIHYLDRPIYPGIGVYRVPRHIGWSEIWDQVQMVRDNDFHGMIFFNLGSLLGEIHTLKERYYQKKALTPPMTWKQNVAMVKPVGISAEVLADTIHIKWDTLENVHSYVLYADTAISRAENIVNIYPGKSTGCKVPLIYADHIYYLTAVNRIGMESGPQPVILD